MSPNTPLINLSQTVNDFVDWLVLNHGDSFSECSQVALQGLLFVESFMLWLPWWVVVLSTMGLAYWGSKRLKLSCLMGLATLSIVFLGLWDMAMQTLALMIVATFCSILISLPLGILMSRSSWIRLGVLPLLDIMQTMPSFVYLIPALMLFGLGKVPALFATLIYAMPPLVRLTDLGIRMVDRSVSEAVDAFGVGRWFKLFHVELPLALPTILAGINQTTMMALSMVVIASMIGARGLGEQVLLGIQRLDAGQGVQAGLAIVALAVVIDRITQAFGKPESQAESVSS